VKRDTLIPRRDDWQRPQAVVVEGASAVADG